MAHFLFISINDINAYGMRVLSSHLISKGHRSSIIFLKRPGFPYTNHETRYFEEAKKIQKGDWVGINSDGFFYRYSRGPEITGNEKDILLDTINEIKPDVIGFSVTSPLIPRAGKISELIKENFNLPVIWGGSGATVEPESCLEHCDYVCIGEAEQTVQKIAERLDKKKNFSDTPNLFYKLNGQIIKKRLYPLIQDLDNIAFQDVNPAGKYLIEDDSVFHNFSEISYSGNYHVMGSRGCPFHCSYCTESYYKSLYSNEKFLRRRSPENIIDEIKEAQKFVNIQRVQFEDEIFSMEYNWLEKFKGLYKEQINLPFVCYIYPGKDMEKRLLLLKETGLFVTCLSLQSGSKRINKDVFMRPFSPDLYFKAAKILTRLNIPFYTDVITYNPFETEKDLEETLNMLSCSEKPYDVYINKLYVLKNTAMAKKIKTDLPDKAGSILPDRIFYYYSRLFHLAVKEDKLFLDFLKHSTLIRWNPYILRSGFWLSFLRRFSGTVSMTDENLKNWERIIQNRRFWFENQGVHYVVVAEPFNHIKQGFSLFRYKKQLLKSCAGKLAGYLAEYSGINIIDAGKCSNKDLHTIKSVIYDHLDTISDAEKTNRKQFTLYVSDNNLFKKIKNNLPEYVKKCFSLKTNESLTTLKQKLADNKPAIVMESSLQCMSHIRSSSGNEDIVSDFFYSMSSPVYKINCNSKSPKISSTGNIEITNKDNTMIVTGHNDDPGFEINEIQLPQDVLSIVMFEMSAPGNTYLQVFYKTELSPDYTEEQSIRIPVNEKMKPYFFQLWPDKYINGLRIDPGAMAGKYSIKQFEIRKLIADFPA